MNDSKFKKYSFHISQKDIDLAQFVGRYHFDEKDRPLILAAGGFLAELLPVKAGIRYEKDHVLCAATLSEKYDRLLDLAEEDEEKNLLLAFAMECFAMELLSKGYERMNEAVHEETGRWMGTYHFLSVEDMADRGTVLLSPGPMGTKEPSPCPELGIILKNGMLYPSKSVIFTAPYVDGKDDKGCHNCDLCSNTGCLFRQEIRKREEEMKKREQGLAQSAAYSYGVSRVFGGGKGL